MYCSQYPLSRLWLATRQLPVLSVSGSLGQHFTLAYRFYSYPLSFSGRSALPGLPDPGDKATMMSYIQLASRILMVLLSLEFLTSLGAVGTVIAIPVILAVLVGYQMPWSGVALLLVYFLHNILNSAFWSIDASGSFYRQYRREVLKYEFVQTISIMGGLLLLVSSGPGLLSVDERMRRKNF